MDTSKGRVTVLFLSFVSDNWRKFLFTVAAIAVIIVFLLIPRGQAGNESVVISDQNLFPELIEEEPEEDVGEQVVIQAMIVVDVKGAVRHPGVYPMQDDDRLIDAINAAGGYVPEADSRLLNHAMRLTDELLIYVPLEGEELPEGGTDLITSGISEASDGIININTADESELMTISGIGPAKAATIIQFRNEHGPFSTPESLMEISGIGQKTFEKLEHQIKVK